MKIIIIYFFPLISVCISQDFWEKTDGPYGCGYKCLAISLSGDIFSGTNDGLFCCRNNEDNWTHIREIDADCIVINSNGEIFAGFIESWGGGVNRSSDNGENWTEINNGLQFYGVSSLAINTWGDIFAVTGGGVFRSIDNGDNWTQINNGLKNTYYLGPIATNSSGDIFVGIKYDGVFRSTDNGDNWTQIIDGLTSLTVRCLATNSSEVIFAATDEGVFRSTDNGDNWSKVNYGLTNLTVTCLAINSNGHIFAGTVGGMFCSKDNGDNWTEINDGLPISSVTCLAINSNDHIFAGTDDGLFRSIKKTTSVEGEDIIPSKFSLSQNYPNPFNPITIVKYTIPKQSNVTLKVFDLLGSETSTLVNKEQPCGNYEVEFSAKGGASSGGDTYDLPSGIYFYRLQAFPAESGNYTANGREDDFVETKKMILLK